jgi:glutaminyl-tRNA synthetase
VREDLNKKAPRVMAVLDPVKLVITNYPENKEEWLKSENNPEDDEAGFRTIPFSRELYIERDDFKEDAGRKYFRLTLNKEVRLKNAYIIKGERIIKNDAGVITEIQCSYDPDSLSGSGTEASMRKVKGTLHWVSAGHAIEAEVREYDRLFLDAAPDSQQDRDFMEFINPDSLHVIKAFIEPGLKTARPGDRFQFQRLGYFNVDDESTPDYFIFNKTVGLRDTWAKQNPQEASSKDHKQQRSDGRKPIEVIKQLGKKYTNLPESKQQKTKAEIQRLAQEVSYDELSGLFDTALKKSY